ncbi:hypothetical protein R6Q59_005267 [Mikania micrantha]
MDSTHKRLPYLESIELNGLFEMSHVWKCKDRNIFLIPQHQPALQLQLPFQNLTNIVLGDCHRLKYLFSPLMVKYLSNLKSVIIYECDGIEEIISSRDDDANEEENFASSTSSHQISTTSLFFPQLNILELEYLPCLRSLDDACDTIHDQSQVSGEVLIHAFWSSLCQCPRRILLFRCDAISVLIPWYIVGQMERLEELGIWNCKKITNVFESDQSSIIIYYYDTVKITNFLVNLGPLKSLRFNLSL